MNKTKQTKKRRLAPPKNSPDKDLWMTPEDLARPIDLLNSGKFEQIENMIVELEHGLLN